jgi:predicted acetyltransferase
MTVDVRRCSDGGEYERAFMALGQYFGAADYGEWRDYFDELLPLERMYAARDGGEIVGGTGSFPFRLSVPGGDVACAGTTAVGVSPTHRRRGILRAMMRSHLDDVHERAEPLAALWATEEGIYGRFGYGRAAFTGELAVPKERSSYAAARELRGRVRLIEPDEAFTVFPPLWDSFGRVRPGVFSRSGQWWEKRVIADPREHRDGAGPKRFALLELDGAPAGYAVYRHRASYEAGSSTGSVDVVEAICGSSDAVAELWRFLLDIDWTASTTASLVPPDHPLFFLLAEPRRMRYRVGDGLWVRLVDAGAALAARTYAGDGDVVLDLRDEFCPWNEGRWRVGRGGVERTTAAADVSLDAPSLAAAYLGGIGMRQLAQGGRVEELTPEALARADAVFRHGLHPWCPEIF